MPVLEELSVTLYSPDADLRALVYADTDQMASSLTSLVSGMWCRGGVACSTCRVDTCGACFLWHEVAWVHLLVNSLSQQRGWLCAAVPSCRR